MYLSCEQDTLEGQGHFIDHTTHIDRRIKEVKIINNIYATVSMRTRNCMQAKVS